MASQPEPDPSDADKPAAGDGASRPGPADSVRLARQLAGQLPCAVCHYDLKGLSVRDVCPECGTPIRATILAAVDPYAGVLRPITWPRVTALGIVVWSLGALAAAIITWAMRAMDALTVTVGVAPTPPQALAPWGQWCVFLSAVGALALVRPHAGIPPRQILAAIAGIAALLGFAAVYQRLHIAFDPFHMKPYFNTDTPDLDRTVLRLVGAGLLLIAIFGLRPNARLLAARSLLMRLGRIERQTMLFLGAAIGAAAVGDGLHLLVDVFGDVPARIGTTLGNFLIAVGSMLFTLGLLSVFIDCLRIAPVLLRPPLSYRQIVEGTRP
jgi:hypothetical protein